MWFRNLQIYRLPTPWAMTAEQLRDQIDRASLDPLIDLAFVALADLWEVEPAPITFFPSISQPERT